MESDKHDPRPVNVYQARDALQAHALSNYLAEHGIAAYLSGDLSSEGILEADAMLWVSSQEVVQATSLLQDWEEKSRAQNELSPSVGSFQFSLGAILANTTLLSFVFAYVALVKDGWQLVPSICTMFVLGNLCCMGFNRRRHERRLQGRMEAPHPTS